MDFDIDSFLNETFKKVEKKDKKKINENKINQINDSIKEENIKTNTISIIEKTKNNNIKSVPIEFKKTNKGQSNNLKAINLIEKENEILLSKKTQRIIEQKSTINKNNLNNDSKNEDIEMQINSQNIIPKLNEFRNNKIETDNSLSKKIEFQNLIKNFKYNYDNNVDIIDNDVYQNINIFSSKLESTQNNTNISNKNNSKNKNDKEDIKINDILLPLFPNEKVFYSEFNSEKIFLLDKFISKGENKKKKKQKNKDLKMELNEENINLESQINNYQKKLYKKEKESSIINKLKTNKNLNYNSILEIMYPLWQKYLKGLLNKNQNLETIFSKMVKADLHGAIIRVCESVNKNNIGIEGINLLESKRTFCLLDKKNEIKIILKKGSVFGIDISFAYDETIRNNENNNNEFTNNNENTKIKLPMLVKIIGDNFMYKSSFRTKAKYKNRYVL